MTWNDAQRAAIAARGGNLLVSAAAGSGKTAVLAARILSLVQEGVRVDALLVVTFTRAAAAEMRARILRLLQEAGEAGDAQVAQQALRVERADILTLHGFCTKVCRAHFQAAGVDPTFRVADGAEIATLRDSALEEALTLCYEAMSQPFAYAAASLSQKELWQAVDALHTFLMARPDPWAWLEAAIAAHALPDDAALADTEWMRVLREGIQSDADAAVEAYQRLADFSHAHALYEEYAEKHLQHAIGYAQSMSNTEDKLPNKPRKPKDADEALEAQFVALQKRAAALLKRATDAAAKLPGYRAEHLRAAGRVLAGVADAVRCFDERFTARKAERNLLDFHDLEHRALRALSDPAVADALRAQYAHVFIDEYQDSSLIQEEILSRVCRDNLFMVGDVKQSIYRFRLAEPSLFLKKLSTFSPQPDSPNRRIALNANYRAHKLLLDAINAVFERVFCGGAMEMPYPPDARLAYGTAPDWPGAPAELHLLPRPETAELEDEAEETDPAPDDEPTEAERNALTREAEAVAARIRTLIGRRDGEHPPYALRDMAILMRAVRGRAGQVVDVLRAHGIAAWSDLGEDTLQTLEVRAMLSLLQVVDNRRQDLPLLAAMRGPALGLTSEDLAQIRQATPGGSFAEAALAFAEGDTALARAVRGFFEKVQRWSLDARVLPLDRLLRALYDETGYYAWVGALPDGAARQARLRTLSEHAGQFQRLQMGGLGAFLRYIERIRASEGLAARDLTAQDNVVRVMTIHKSKGLQFPIVFLMGAGDDLKRKKSQNARVSMHQELGAAFPSIDPDLRTEWPTLAQDAIALRQRQQALAEEARVLYVALTRAERRLIIIGTDKKEALPRWREGALTPSMAARAASFLDWLAPCALKSPAWRIIEGGLRGDAPLPRADAAANLNRILQNLRPIKRTTSITRALDWRAPDRPDQPLKQSVSALVKAEQKQGEEPALPQVSALPHRPGFMEQRGMTATERGDAIHAFLRAVPLGETDLPAFAESMRARGLLTSQQVRALPFGKLAACLQSPTFARMRAAETLHREWPFTLRIPAGEGWSLLQGVIDCCFLEEGEWVVVDYKSDRADDLPTLMARYAPQIRLYAQALERLTGVPVREMQLFLTDRGEGYGVG
ncbi:MAG: UvrD-helicase domain-containing protein [Oscillospiraceae bacterium]|jgi:ATP-dependent helicase/nuclease subunit A|nr:UvrD-helicase domain-containing protein [Oscillospiraceae bacterium]